MEAARRWGSEGGSMSATTLRPKWLITGATGLLGAAVSKSAATAEVDLARYSLRGRDGSTPLDLARSPSTVVSVLNAENPDVVIHLAAISKPAQVERNFALAWRLNVGATQAIAAWCRRRGRRMLFASTDHVFDGLSGPYSEAATPNPQTEYGRLKTAGERLVGDARGLVLRLGWVLNDTDGLQVDFVQGALSRLRGGMPVKAVTDERRTPIFSSAAAELTVALAAGRVTGAVHVAGKDHLSPYELLMHRARTEDLDVSLIAPIRSIELAQAFRPKDVRLSTSLLDGLMLPSAAQV